jgi:uncharacterized protein (TIGR03083 family)
MSKLLLDRIRQESELLARTAESVDRAGLETLVPGCPGLTLAEVTRHVGSVHRMAWHWIREGQRPADWRRDPAPHQSLSDYVRSGAASLLAELAAHPPQDPCSTWQPSDQTYGFWRRRMAHESTVHRVDVQQAAGMPVAEIPEDIALDGIDEALHLWFVHRLGLIGVAGTRRGLVAVRAGGRQWLAYADPHGTSVDSVEETVPNASVSGTPMEIYLWLWGRVPDQRIRRDGNQDVIAQLWALLRIAMR